MLGVEMYYTVKTLLDQGKNLSQIAREVGIDRKTVRKIRDKLKEGGIKPPEFSRKSILDPYKEQIIEYLSEGLSGVLIHQRLVNEHNLSISYSCVKKYLRKLRCSKGIYVPLISPPGEEAQVDFGYVGYLYDTRVKKKVKSWIFCMVLSHSRYKYYEIVQSQDVKTFIRCHINAFEFFGGAPKVVKIDNLKSGVLGANFYEPIIQHEYAQMLRFYGSSPFACKVRYPQEKGKVESGIKYVKNNFFKSNKEKDYYRVKDLLRDWQDNVCNRKIHGTTRKVPYEQFLQREKSKLLPLPSERYELYDVLERVVNRYGHITYLYNFYSVPYDYIGQKVSVRSNGKLLRIYNENQEEIAVHTICNLKGEFITNEVHHPKLKSSDYELKSIEIGKYTYKFYIRLKEEKPYHYHRVMQGIFSLTRNYGKDIVELACRRATEYNSISYISVKRICELGLYTRSEESSKGAVICESNKIDLSKYDELRS